MTNAERDKLRLKAEVQSSSWLEITTVAQTFDLLDHIAALEAQLTAKAEDIKTLQLALDATELILAQRDERIRLILAPETATPAWYRARLEELLAADRLLSDPDTKEGEGE